jgi:hypothetical protein
MMSKALGPENALFFALVITGIIVLISTVSSVLHHYGVLQLLVRAVLSRDSRAPDTLLSLAREIHPGAPANARLIIKETLRIHPENEDALTLQRLWDPAPSPAPAPAQL